MDLLKTSLVKLRIARLKGQLSQDILNSWCLYTTHFQQFTKDVNGVQMTSEVYIPNNKSGFSRAIDAYKAAKHAGIRPYSQQGKTMSYGQINVIKDTRVALTINDILDDTDNVAPIQILN